MPPTLTNPSDAGSNIGGSGGSTVVGAGANASVELVLQQVESLPTLSPVAVRAMTIAGAADGEFDDLVRIIECDPVLSSRIVSLCRRASAGVTANITTVKRAVVMLGWEAVQSAVLSIQIYEMMRQSPQSTERRDDRTPAAGATGPTPALAFDRVGFWQHSIAVAACAELLAENHRAMKVRPDEAFIAGLVHDLGKLVLDWILPRTYARVLALAEARGIGLDQAERQVIGLDHHVVGKRLAEHWGLPHLLQDSMWLVGQPALNLPELEHRQTLALVTAADAICRAMHLGWSGEATEPPALDAVCASAGLSEAKVRSLIPKLHDAMARRTSDMGLAEQTSEQLVVASIMSANQRLARLHQSSRERAETARTQSRVLEAVCQFTASARPGSSVSQVVDRVAESFTKMAGPGYTAVVCQNREGENWRLFRYSPTAAPDSQESLEPPRDERGEAIGVPRLADGRSLGDTVGLLTWLSEHLGQPPMAPDLRRLKVVPIVSGIGPAAVLLHDRDFASAPALGRSLDALVAVWAASLTSAAQHEGARRLTEALAHTTRVLTETQSRLAETESLARLGELTAGAAHELNNPLTVISARAQLLGTRLRDPQDIDAARQIADASERLTAIISSLHFVARPPDLTLAPTNLTDLLGTVLHKARERFIAVHAAGGAPGAAKTPPMKLLISQELGLAALDPALFGRAMTELVSNALESSPKSVVELKAVIDPLDDRLVLTLRDDGRGMSEHALKHAFDPFFSEKPAGRQTGLGLTSAWRIVGLHGGEIRLTSKVGEGTTATVSLPDWRWTGAVATPTRRAA